MRDETQSFGSPVGDTPGRSASPGTQLLPDGNPDLRVSDILAALAPLPDDPPGYALKEQIGHGGMGEVYRAVDAEFGREVAVKVLQEAHATRATSAARFLDEARITGQLQHPGIPAVYRVGALPNGHPFLAMKLIKGETLDARLRAGPAPPGRPPSPCSRRSARRSGTPTPTGSSTGT